MGLPAGVGVDIDGVLVSMDKDGSAGRDLKKFSIFFELSATLAFIHPVAPFFVLTKNHLTPPALKVSASGDKPSSPSRDPASRDDSSGAVNNWMGRVSVDVRPAFST
jgi:hypothetical protein